VKENDPEEMSYTSWQTFIKKMLASMLPIQLKSDIAAYFEGVPPFGGHIIYHLSKTFQL
jgi:hypothetical protein